MGFDRQCRWSFAKPHLLKKLWQPSLEQLFPLLLAAVEVAAAAAVYNNKWPLLTASDTGHRKGGHRK